MTVFLAHDWKMNYELNVFWKKIRERGASELHNAIKPFSFISRDEIFPLSDKRNALST